MSRHTSPAPIHAASAAAGVLYRQAPHRVGSSSSGQSGDDKPSRRRHRHERVPMPPPSKPEPVPVPTTLPLTRLEAQLLTIPLPDPGPSHYAMRRALWLTPPEDPPTPPSPSPSRIKLEALLNQVGAVESEEVWKAGLKNVWKGLVGGNQLRKRLPLSIVLKILQAGWLRDGTWPAGMVAPEPDDILPEEEILPFPPTVPSYPSTNASVTPAHYTPMSVSSVHSDNDMDEDLDLPMIRRMENIDEDDGPPEDGRHEGG